MVEAVLKLSMGRMPRRSRMCLKQERDRLEVIVTKESEMKFKSNLKIANRGIIYKSSERRLAVAACRGKPLLTSTIYHAVSPIPATWILFRLKAQTLHSLL